MVWIRVGPTRNATQVIDGLAPLARYSFRARLVIKDVEGAWSDPIRLLVR